MSVIVLIKSQTALFSSRVKKNISCLVDIVLEENIFILHV